ncbi:Glucose-repressible alcohol dehydrogenase transcriptional effector [Gonapodya sp. JEL0774]|nr:Glucose-repressible alcohol dehydrogenase transcriptional effector [Gonapodya sp. JEL0774]
MLSLNSTGDFDIDSVPEFVPALGGLSTALSGHASSKTRLSYASVASVTSEKKSDSKKSKSGKSRSSISSTSSKTISALTVSVASTSPANLPAPVEFPPFAPKASATSNEEKCLSRSAKRRRRRARKAKEAEVATQGAAGPNLLEADGVEQDLEDDEGIADDESEHPRSERGSKDTDESLVGHGFEGARSDLAALLGVLSKSFNNLVVTAPDADLASVARASELGAIAVSRSPSLRSTVGGTTVQPNVEVPTVVATDDFEFEIEPYFAEDAPKGDRYPIEPEAGIVSSPQTAVLSPLESNTDSEAVPSPTRSKDSYGHDLKPPIVAPASNHYHRRLSFTRPPGSSDSSVPSSPIEINGAAMGGRSPRSPLFGHSHLPSPQFATLSSSQGSYNPLSRGSLGTHYQTDESGGEETVGGWSVPSGSLRGSSFGRSSLKLHPGAASAAAHYASRRRSFTVADLADVEDESRPTFDLDGKDIPPGVAVDKFSRSSFWPGTSGQIVLPVRRWRNGGLVGGDNRNFSVGSYNVLCPLYATKQKFSATDDKYLDWDWRKWRIIEEIAVYGPDILCLQVCIAFRFIQRDMSLSIVITIDRRFLQRNLMDSFFRNFKFSATTEFSNPRRNCMRWMDVQRSQSKFQLLVVQAFRYHDISIAEPGGVSDARDSYVRDLALRFNPFDNVALIAVFRNKFTNARLRVANTHFHWDPQYKDTKLLQACVLMDWLSYYHPEHPLIICGDLNSLPEDPVLELILRGNIPSSVFGDRDFGKFTHNRETISHPCRLDEAYKTQGADRERDLPFTNATPDFRGHIDHIFYTSNDLLLRDVLAGVESNYLDHVSSLPTALFPSDHLFLLGWFRERREPTYRRATNSPRLGPSSSLSPRLGPSVSQGITTSPRMIPLSGTSPRMTMSPRPGSFRGPNMGLGMSPPPFGLDAGMRWDAASGGRSWNR